MDALDLTTRPPRAPRELLPGLPLLMMARTVDKLRATLPGGNLGTYQISGFSSRLLEALGIAEHELRAEIARASSDGEVAAWIAERTDASRYDEFNTKLEELTVGDRLGDEAFVRRYPIVKHLPPEMSRLDMLAADDAEMFANP